MEEEGIGTIILIGIIIVVVIFAFIFLNSLFQALSKNVFWYGFLVGIVTGIGGTLGFIRGKAWWSKHVKIE